MYIGAACDVGCSTCNTNGAAKCDGQAFCPYYTYFDEKSKTCKGEQQHITFVIIIIIIKIIIATKNLQIYELFQSHHHNHS